MATFQSPFSAAETRDWNVPRTRRQECLRYVISKTTLKPARIYPMTKGMNVSNQTATSLLDSALTAQSTRVDMGVAVLKKAQDLEKQEGAAMVQMLENVSIPAGEPGHLLDAYA